jgi:hypothetical protein
VGPSLIRTSAFAALLGLAPLWGLAQEPGISAKLHPWGRFDPGTWKTVYVVTETLNEQGQVSSTSTTDTKTTLVDLDNDGVTLEIQACMEVAGKRFDAEPQTVKQGFHGELLGPNLKFKAPTGGEVVIEGQKIPCKVQQLESLLPNGKTVTTVYYSATVAPYVLRRESVTTDADGKSTLSETTIEVCALNMPVRIRRGFGGGIGETRNGSKVKTVHKNASGMVVTWSDVVPEVPGGVVSNSCKELDKAGRLVRRSTLELSDYNDDPDKDRSGLFHSRKRHRTKSPPR